MLKKILFSLFGLFILFTIIHKLYIFIKINNQQEILVIQNAKHIYKYDKDYNLIEVKLKNKIISYEYHSNGTRKNKKVNGEVVEKYRWFGFNQFDGFNIFF